MANNKDKRANDANWMAILQAFQGTPQGNATAVAATLQSDIKRDGADKGDIDRNLANTIFAQANDPIAFLENMLNEHPDMIDELDSYLEEKGIQINDIKELIPVIQSYLVEKRKYEDGGLVLEYQPGGKTNEFPIFKNGQKCSTGECAEFQNDTLRNAGFSTYGNAWNIGNAKLYWSGYDVANRPEMYDLDKVREYNFKASDKFLKEFDSSTMLDPDQKYIVNMFYKGSPAQEQAYNEGRDGIAGTHTGYVSWNPNTNQWEVTHNIHGRVHVDPFTKIQGRNGQYGITAIFIPKKKNVIDKAKEWVRSKFAEGGQFEEIDGFVNVDINGITYHLLHLTSEEEKERGLMDVEELDPQEGALFDYSNEPQVELSFWMKDTTIPLLICFVNEDGKVISVHQGEPMSEEMITENSEFISYVIEVGIYENINPGDQTSLGKQNINEEIEEDEDEEDTHPELGVNRLYVYGSDGSVQAELQGGERIFSRKSSKVIISKAKKAYASKEDKDYKALGRYIFKEMDAQDGREPEYVEN